MKYLTLTLINKDKYEIHFEALTIGECIRDADGYFYLFLNNKNSGWSDYTLLELGEALKELNREWNEQVKKMKTLEEKMHEIILTRWSDIAARDCTKLAEQECIGFKEWCDTNWSSTSNYTIKECFQLYLRSKI